MANLAIVGSHSTNGVAAIHSGLLRTTTVRDWPRCFPSVSITRPTESHRGGGCCWQIRRFLALSPSAIGDGWITDLSQLSRLRLLADDQSFRDAFRKAKRDAKLQFADWLRAYSGQTVDPDTIFDCQVKRIHEYKRQMLMALRIVVFTSGCARTRSSICGRAHSSLQAKPLRLIDWPS